MRLFAPILGLGIVLGVAGQAMADEASNRAAAAVIERFVAAWNAEDDEAIRRELNYPNFTLVSEGRLIVAEKSVEFRAGFAGLRAQEGWRRSTLDAIEIVKSGSGQVHCMVDCSRYRDDAEPYLSGRVLYVVTEQDGHWGLQLRVPVVLPDPIAPADGDARVQAVQKLLDDFFVFFNRGDNAALQEITHFPHVFLLGNGRAAIAHEPAELVMDFAAMREREGWHHSTLDSVEFLNQTGDIALCEIVFSRHHEDGTRYRTVPALWIVTKRDGDWGLQFRSLLPPTFSKD